jgi:hypothetical protein
VLYRPPKEATTVSTYEEALTYLGIKKIVVNLQHKNNFIGGA